MLTVYLYICLFQVGESFCFAKWSGHSNYLHIYLGPSPHLLSTCTPGCSLQDAGDHWKTLLGPIEISQLESKRTSFVPIFKPVIFLFKQMGLFWKNIFKKKTFKIKLPLLSMAQWIGETWFLPGILVVASFQLVTWWFQAEKTKRTLVNEWRVGKSWSGSKKSLV